MMVVFMLSGVRVTVLKCCSSSVKGRVGVGVGECGC